jgi:Flp pilus assembly protein protease CpaA
VFSFDFFLNTNTFFLISSLCFGSLLFYLSYQDFKKNKVSSNSLYLLFSFSAIFFIHNLILNFKNTNIFSLQNILTISLSFIFLYFSLYGKDKYLGQGDYLIFASILLFFGMENFINIFVYSVWIGSFISIIYMYKKFGKYKREVQVPFIPFLFLGTLFFHITQYKVFIIKDILEIIKFLTN